MRLTVLGHWGAYPGAGEATSGYLLQTEETNILIDCGSGVLSLLQTLLPLEKLDALVLSHYHADHIADVHCLQYAMMIQHQLNQRVKPLIIYGHDQDKTFTSLGYKEYCQAQSIQEHTPLEIGPFTFEFTRTVHPAYCLAMRITDGQQTLCYTADTEWSDQVLQLATGSDILLCESSLYTHQHGAVPGHLTAREAGQLAYQANVNKLILTHLPHFGDHKQLIAESRQAFDGPVELAEKGKII